MGYVYADIQLKNPKRDDLQPITAPALVDTGALMLCIPEHVALQLSVETNSHREITTTDGRKSLVPYVGPIEVRFANRSCFVGALVLGNQILLGSVPMEDMDLVVSPASHKLEVNPANPNFPHALVKAVKL
jgi:clan AA aspartic protease